MGCYNSWANLRCSSSSPLEEKSLWNGTIGPLGTNFSEIFIEIYTFSFNKMHLKISSGKWQPFCLCLNVLIYIEFWSHSMPSTRTWYINGLVQERHNSIANALELRLSCTNPSIVSPGVMYFLHQPINMWVYAYDSWPSDHRFDAHCTGTALSGLHPCQIGHML